MNTKLVVLWNGRPLLEYPIELDADVGLAVGATMALSEFHRLIQGSACLTLKSQSASKTRVTCTIRGSVAANSLFLEKFSLICL
jgi:hypothetical protein